LIGAYADWCRKTFGEVVSPEQSAVADVEKTVDLFSARCEVPSCVSEIVSMLLNQAFDERFGSFQE
jgi:hypothetical protein